MTGHMTDTTSPRVTDKPQRRVARCLWDSDGQPFGQQGHHRAALGTRGGGTQLHSSAVDGALQI